MAYVPPPTNQQPPRLLAEVLAEALRLIDRYGCTNYTHGRCSTDASRSRDAKYSAEQWCDACIAADALVRASQEGTSEENTDAY